MKKRRKIRKKPEKHIFSYINYNVGYAESSENKRPIIYSDKQTLEIKKEKGKFIIYELNRKQPPKRLRTFKKGKRYNNESDVKKAVIENKIIFIKKRETNPNFQHGNSNFIQSSRRPNKGFFQLVAIVDVYNTRKKVGQSYTCFSLKRTKDDIPRAYNDLEAMGKAKFMDEFGLPDSAYKYIEAHVKEPVRYQYVRYKK